MLTRKNIKHSLLTLAVAAVGTIALTLSSQAVVLVMGAWTPIAGTTAAARPELAGTVVLDNMVPLKVLFTNTDKKQVVWTGKLQNRVVREKKGNLTFYYRIFSDTTNTVSIQGISMFTQPATHGFSNDADFRTDGLGSYSPDHAMLSAADSEFSFLSTPIPPGQTSRFCFIRTNATNYALNDYTFLWYGGGMFHIYGPAH